MSARTQLSCVGRETMLRGDAGFPDGSAGHSLESRWSGRQTAFDYSCVCLIHVYYVCAMCLVLCGPWKRRGN